MIFVVENVARFLDDHPELGFDPEVVLPDIEERADRLGFVIDGRDVQAVLGAHTDLFLEELGREDHVAIIDQAVGSTNRRPRHEEVLRAF